MKQHEYGVEEFHRGEWIPLKAIDKKGEKTGDQKVVKITEEEAETMNIDSKKVGIRYVKKGESGDGVKSIDKMNKGELEAKAEELGVEFTEEHTNNEKRAAFLQGIVDAKVV